MAKDFWVAESFWVANTFCVRRHLGDRVVLDSRDNLGGGNVLKIFWSVETFCVAEPFFIFHALLVVLCVEVFSDGGDFLGGGVILGCGDILGGGVVLYD